MRIFVNLFSLVTACGLAACASTSDVVSGDKLMERKPISVAEWDGGQRRLRLASERMWIMVSDGAGTIGWRTPTGAEGERVDDVIFWNFSKKNGPSGSLSTAVPITKDGYFLTAKHCLRGGREPALFMYDRNARKLPKEQAQIVWQSSDEADLALLRTSQVIKNPFELAELESLSQGDKVGAAGWSGLGRTEVFGGMAAGEIRSVKKLERKWWCSAESTCWQVEHNAPLQPGDSGGPLIDAKGLLIGINSGSRFKRASNRQQHFDGDSVKNFRGISNIPDKAWLMQRIEEDRRSRSR